MLEIFTDKSLFKEEDFVFDNENYFNTNSKNEKICSEVIQAIESGTYLDERRFYDRFGVALYMRCLSTSSKTLINIASSDKVFYGNELGSNAREYMIWCIDGKVFLEPTQSVSIEGSAFELDRIRINGVKPSCIEDIESVL